ncbi:restriction endonuclease subunit S [Flavobacterium haoranii]|uniref:restriction endonuclease subunit S n=1 Tax=Flavobacterium haoranii TaxID=683124 RepID=UPI001266B7DE|nr:restriction endonuclease subunit S [Flavobacterium haoranii]
MKSNWKIKTVGEICEFINGKGHEKIIDENGKYIVVNSKFVSSNGKIYKKVTLNYYHYLKMTLY